MLAYVREHSVDYVIVHKLDRLARSRADDIVITQAVHAAGARLVSSTEGIDTTPNGVLLHGIMASIAEFYSRNLAQEVMKGMRQKAIQGGHRAGRRSAISTSAARPRTDASIERSNSTTNGRHTSPGRSTPMPLGSGASLSWSQHFGTEDFGLGRPLPAPPRR
ncbi:hypothetical protein GCM10027416_19500 [Okibacterium endophyticum]